MHAGYDIARPGGPARLEIATIDVAAPHSAVAAALSGLVEAPFAGAVTA